MLNLSVILVSKLIEILTYFNSKIQTYLSEKDIKSSSLLSSSDEEKNETLDSDDYLETLLYGKCLNQLYYKEILFILDLQNYNSTLEEFKTNFQKCVSGSYNISNALNDFLKTLDININTDNEKLGRLTLNEKLIIKSSPNDNLLFHHKTHSHLHPKKVNEVAQKIIDEIYATYLNYIKPNN